MNDWVDDLAAALSVGPLSPDETDRLLATAREVAHGVERRVTPLAAFLMGSAVQERLTSGASREEAIDRVLALVETLIPQGEPGDLP